MARRRRHAASAVRSAAAAAAALLLARLRAAAAATVAAGHASAGDGHGINDGLEAPKAPEGGALNATEAALVASQAGAPWFFSCSNHPDWNAFREKMASFKHKMGAVDSPEDLLEEVQELLAEANQLGHRFEPTFVKYASSWQVFHMCEDAEVAAIPEEMKTDFCFYGFAVVQWLALFGKQHFGSVPGMAEWARNARGFLNDASKFNGMHFLESSGWPVKLSEMARGLSDAFLGRERYRPARDAALPGAGFAAGRRVQPQHTRRLGVRRLSAVGISYHTALLREPMAFWAGALQRHFIVDTTVHILDAGASTPEDVRRLHAHCAFLEGAWCASDERLLQLSALFENVALSCHTGDSQTRHPFITDAEAYHRLFLELMGNDPILRAADVMLCGEPVLFCKLLSYFGAPVIGYISTPLSVYVRAADRGKWYQDFYDMALDGRHIFAVTTPIFGEWITYATGIELPVVSPTCLYTQASYWPVRAREVLLLRTVSLFWDSQCVLNHFARDVAGILGTEPALEFTESTGLSKKERVGYAAFAEFLATVIFPYAFSQFWFYEFYSMGGPIYMPAAETLPLFVNQDYATCPDFEGLRPGHVPHGLHPFSPFDKDDWEAMTYWTNYTDFLRFPHIGYFESIPQLVWLLEREDLRAKSRLMQAARVEHLGAATAFWLGALERVAGLRGKTGEDRHEEEHAARDGAHGGAGYAAGAIRDELRDLSTRQPCGGSVARPDGWCWLANDGDTRQDHPHEYHFDADQVGPSALGSSHWWVQLRRVAADPEVKLWARECCCEAYGNRLWLLLGNSSARESAVECGSVEAASGSTAATICSGVGGYLFVEARGEGGWGYQEPGVAVLMLPEVRVLSRD